MRGINTSTGEKKRGRGGRRHFKNNKNIKEIISSQKIIVGGGAWY